MQIRIEMYEDSGRIFIDGKEVQNRADREIDIEDFFPILRQLGATVEAFQWDDIAPDIEGPNPDTSGAANFS